MRLFRSLFFTLFCLAALTARAAHTQATLMLSDSVAKPGDTVWVGVDLKMEPGWHTYWKNPGEAGMATTIAWQLPPGITAGKIEWPLPYKFPPIEVTTYGYTNETMLLVPLKIGRTVPDGTVTLIANLAWLECEDVCIPVKTSVQTTLEIGDETKPSADAAVIGLWKAKVPQASDSAAWACSAWWKGPANGDTRDLIIDRRSVQKPAENTSHVGADFYPGGNENYEIQPSTTLLTATTEEVRLGKVVKKYSGEWPKEISGVIAIEASDGTRRGVPVQLPVMDAAPAGLSASASVVSETNAAAASFAGTSGGGAAPAGRSLGLMLLYAFIGGLILNIMPCVLPVIALKILGFVGEARSEPRRVRNLGFIYGLGVLASFSAMAAVFIGFKAAGQHIGWGMQFGSPVFVVCLTTLVLLVALNLFGVFEVTPGGKVMNAAGHLASKHGAPGAFFNGLLATTLATPCTAAYMAGALAFAFTQSAGIIFLILLFVGLGLATPYVLLSCNPALLRFLPKPGAWMEKFKVAMGFPMLATVVWLFNVAASDYGSRVLWLGIFLVIVAFAAWIFGQFIQRGSRGKGFALGAVLVLLVGGYSYALEARLQWREMAVQNSSTNSLIASANGVTWEPWSPEAIDRARAAGKPILVDFTATWCLTCNAIVKPALENPSVIAELKKINAVALLGDYTRTPQRMTEEIAKFGGAGVPLVVVYPKNPDARAIVLPQPDPVELPSSYSRKVLEALDQAVQ